MITAYLTKIKSYIALGLLLIIIILLAALGLQSSRISKLNGTIEKLDLQNKRSTTEVEFFKAQIQILADFTNSSQHIETITNEKIFDEQKQKAVNMVVADFYK